MLQHLAKLPFIPDSRPNVPRCTAYTNRRLHVAIKPRLQSLISAAFKAYSEAQQGTKLAALAQYAAAIDSIDQNVVTEINKAVSEMT